MKLDVRYGNPRLKTDDALFARTVRYMIESAVFVNRDYIAHYHPPALYDSGVHYRNEPIGMPDHVEDIPVILARRHGDCMHLCAWRVAELREQGEHALPRMIWLPPEKRATPQRVFHVQVRRGNGSIEDPSAKLGMPS